MLTPEQIRQILMAPKTTDNVVRDQELLHTGSTLLNLACTGRAGGGFAKGKYHFIVGDSSSGKTWISLTCMAEAMRNPEFKDYRLIYDNAEDGALMDFGRYFGSKMAERIEQPGQTADGEPASSSTIEEFYYHLDDALEEGRPFIYVLDSMDALSSSDEADKFAEQKDAYRKGKQTAGSYGDGKAKKNSAHMRKVMPGIRDTGSILLVINQTRDNLGFGFEKKTRSGGHALRFYAHLEIWLSVKNRIKKTVKGSPRELGIVSRIQVKKNRFTGRLREVEVPLYHSFGIDDVGSCVEYLLSEGRWTKKGANIAATDFEVAYPQEKLIRYIEEQKLEKELVLIVEELWNEIEEACSVNRRRRYE